MTKQDAKKLFGTATKLCAALEITKTTYYRWPEELPQVRADQVRGAWIRITEEHDRKIIHNFGSAEHEVERPY
jgi:hypothetical protein